MKFKYLTIINLSSSIYVSLHQHCRLTHTHMLTDTDSNRFLLLCSIKIVIIFLSHLIIQTNLHTLSPALYDVIYLHSCRIKPVFRHHFFVRFMDLSETDIVIILQVDILWRHELLQVQRSSWLLIWKLNVFLYSTLTFLINHYSLNRKWMLYLFLIEQDSMTRKVQARRVLQPLCTEMKVRLQLQLQDYRMISTDTDSLFLILNSV